MPSFIDIDAYQDILDAPDPLRRAGLAKRLYADFEAGDLDETEARAAISIFRAIVRDDDESVRREFARFLTPSDALSPDIARRIGADPAWTVAAAFLRHAAGIDTATLVDMAADPTPWRQAAIAGRTPLERPVAAALAEVGVRVAVLILLENDGADIPQLALRRIGERFPGDDQIADMLLERSDVPGDFVEARIHTISDRLRQFVDDTGWLGPDSAARTVGNAVEHGLAEFTLARTPQELRRIFDKWRAERRITRGFVLRLACYGALPALGIALGHVAGLPERRVAALWNNGRHYGRRSLVAKAGFSGIEAALILEAAARFECLEANTTPDRRRPVTRDLIDAFLSDPGTSEAFAKLLERFAADVGIGIAAPRPEDREAA